MASKLKYRQGGVIKTLAGLERELLANRYVYLRNVPKHPSIIMSMTLRTIYIFLNGGSLKYTI